MALKQEPTRTPVGIGKIRVIITDLDGTPAGKSIEFEASVELSDGSRISRHGSLSEHITVAQRQALNAFMVDLRAQAIAQIVEGAT
jgi:hypothetical protein